MNRIKRSRRKGWKMPENTVFVGRPSKWGNPFRVGYLVTNDWFDIFDDLDVLQYFTRNNEVKTNEEAVYLYEKYLSYDLSEEGVLDELKGKNLACWCSLDEKCHADVLLKIANHCD